VWALAAAVAIEIVVTYSRLPPGDLYHVHRHGIANGLGRAVVFLNFPVSLIAIATLPSSYERRPGPRTAAAAAVALVLCLFTVVPGVVSEDDLDVRPINAVAAAGVALAVVLSAGRPLPIRRLGSGPLPVVAPVLLVVALPWIAADLGVSFGGVPVLGQIFQTSELRDQPGVPGLHPAVHHGHHHGMDGVLMALAALLVLRVPLARRRLRLATQAYASLLFCYGLANVVDDAWLEQVVKRDWTTIDVPGVLSLHANWTWLAVVVGAACVFVGYSSRTRSSIHSDIGT
jgi:hypothetical protein